MVTRRALLAGAVPAAAYAASLPESHEIFDPYFLPVFHGFLRNAHATSPSYAVCDFPDGTKLPGCTTTGGKTYVSVSRMMPALAAYAKGRKSTRALEALRLAFRNAFNPAHPDYWGKAPAGSQHQKQVEASVVAWSLWLVRDELLDTYTAAERSRINDWLASCTQYPVRSSNWAWFTALNQAVRLSLAKRWPEFSGDAKWMEEDLRFLDTLAAPGDDGWYTDSRREPVYDYYNSWVFASHFLYWNRVAGADYPEWSRRCGSRLRSFLLTTPFFFGANGSHVLYGRSLIYRWGVLTPLVLAYEQGLWPHSPGLLRAIVRRNFEYHWAIGAFDAMTGKLRETFSESGTPDIHESYIDNGHPYWGMQAFGVFLIPPKDRFWHAREQNLPVEQRDFHVRLEGPRMALSGCKRTGEVRWMQAATFRPGPDYRDKYNKLSYSSRYPFSIIKNPRELPVDSALLFVDAKSGEYAARAGIREGSLAPRGTRVEWWMDLRGVRIEVTTEIEIHGAEEVRKHSVVLPPDTTGLDLEAVEGSIAFPSNDRPPVEVQPLSGQAIVPVDQEGVNLVSRKTRVITLRKKLTRTTEALESRWIFR